MVSRDTRNEDEVLADVLATYKTNPLGYVMFMFPWDTDPSIQQVPLAAGVEEHLTDDDRERQAMYRALYPNMEWGPDLWACDFLMEWGLALEENAFDGSTACDPLQFATVSGHGIGKSVMVAWIIKFIMDTRPRSKGTVTANTAEQLRTKTWAELGKWHRRSLTEHWFEYNTGRGAMALRAKSDPEEWFCTAQTCREENSEAFAGQHAANATSFYIFDEASNVPDKIYEVREGGTTDGEPMIFDFGNGTRNSGHFYEECAGRLRHRYSVRSIDSRHVYITNKTRAKEWVEDFGEDSDFVKVRVRGMFPSAGSMQFVPSGSVKAAQNRPLTRDPHAPLIIGVDVARYGDDESVIYPRLGWDARSWAPRRFRGLDGVQLAQEVVKIIEEFAALDVHEPHIFIDITGGIGASPYDQLVHLGYEPVAVNFGAGCNDKKTYRYKSDELWGDMRAGLAQLCLPKDNEPSGIELFEQLTQREFGYTTKGNYVHLESKKDMKARLENGVGSPDIADALACTFFLPVAPKKLARGEKKRKGINFAESDYDVLDPDH
jgi:hypothetical protein